MATGGCDPSITDGHEVFYEHRCNKCEDKDCITEATAYCINCNECYCESCLGDHNRFIRGHTILREADKDDWGKPVASQDSGMECSEHKGQSIAMYCGHHDVVCCPVCAYLHHGENCKPNMSYIPTVAQGVVSSAEFKKFIATNDALLVRLLNTEKTRTDCLSKLDTSREICKTDIEVIGQNLTHRIEELQHISFADMNNKVDDEKNMIQADIAQCVELRQELNLIQQHMQLSHQVNESSVFVKMKTGGKIHLNCDAVCTVLSNKKMKTFLIKPDSSLQRLFLTNSLGECTESVQEVGSIIPVDVSKHLKETCATRASSEFQQLGDDVPAENSTVKPMFNTRQEKLKSLQEFRCEIPVGISKHINEASVDCQQQHLFSTVMKGPILTENVFKVLKFLKRNPVDTFENSGGQLDHSDGHLILTYSVKTTALHDVLDFAESIRNQQTEEINIDSKFVEQAEQWCQELCDPTNNGWCVFDKRNKKIIVSVKSYDDLKKAKHILNVRQEKVKVTTRQQRQRAAATETNNTERDKLNVPEKFIKAKTSCMNFFGTKNQQK